MTRSSPSAFLFLALLAACHRTAQVGSPATPPARATVRAPSGALMGVLGLVQTENGVHITGTLHALAPGAHGIHLHGVGSCGAADFTSAGPHFNPGAAHHGLENPEGPHAGDLPNITASSSGDATVDLTTPRVTLDAASPTGVFDVDGTAIVVHAGPDDQHSDPAGNSGARVACGVLTR